MNLFRTTLITALCLTLPAWGVRAAVPDIHGIFTGIPSSFLNAPADTGLNLSDFLSVQDARFVTDDEVFPFVISGLYSDNQTFDLTKLEMELQDDLLLPQDDSGIFWSKRKIVILTSLLLLSGMILAFIGLLSGSGSGSGTGYGSGGGGGNPNNPPQQLPQEADPDCVGPDCVVNPQAFSGCVGEGCLETSCVGAECAATNDDCQGDGCGEQNHNCFGENCSSDPDTDHETGRKSIPNNPEPSTLLLAGLGLLIPNLRKKRS